ncbi:MAG: hypothetical protein P8104_00415, partial [Gammaproteobacteria bacterium]
TGARLETVQCRIQVDTGRLDAKRFRTFQVFLDTLSQVHIVKHIEVIMITLTTQALVFIVFKL